jgi:hypothetical protein
MKRKVWKWVLGMIVAATVILGATFWSAQHRATQLFQRHERALGERIAALRARPGARLRLYDPGLPGNGWNDYARALHGLGALPGADSEEIPEFSGDPNFQPDSAKLDVVLSKHAPRVEELRQALRHDEFVPPYRFEDGLSIEDNSNEAIKTAKYLAGQASHLHRSGKDAMALESILLACAMGHDTGRAGAVVNLMIMFVSESVAQAAAQDILESYSLKSSELEAFAGKLDLLWSGRPKLEDAFAVEDVITRRLLMRLVLEDSRGGSSIQELRQGRSWRFLFSRRLALAGALGEMERVYRTAGTLGALPLGDRLDAARRLTEESLPEKNPIARQIIPNLRSLYKNDAAARMHWVLFRIATAIAWYETEKGEAPKTLADLVPRHLSTVPRCPYTDTPLRYAAGKVWSIGGDLKDDGGTPQQSGNEDSPGDVVWTVRRKP